MQEPTFLILTALAAGAQHGYGIMTDVARISDGRVRLRAGTLYAALDRLTKEDGQSAQLVKLRYFAGLTIPEAAEVLGISPRKADSLWSFARAWLRREMAKS